MELTQEHMDAYTLAATENGMIDWAAREDRLGVQAVLNLIDPVPAKVNRIIDDQGARWFRAHGDPMIWVRVRDDVRLTAAKLQELIGIKEWSAE